MTLPKPTRRPQLGSIKQATTKNSNNNNKQWWKPLVAIRWSSFVIFSLSIGILNLLNSHLVIHHDLHHHHHHNDGAHHNNNHNMHASIREILHRHYQKQFLQQQQQHRPKNSHHQMEEEEDVTTTTTTVAVAAAHEQPRLKQMHKKHKNDKDSSHHTQQEEEGHQHQSQADDKSSSSSSRISSTTTASASASASVAAAHQRTSNRQQQQQPSQQSRHHRSIDFIPTQELNLPLDAFSATWWQSRDRFLHQMQLENIGSVEGACFNAIREHEDEVKMTTDWLDFSVEHLSRWWKLLQYDVGESTIAYHRIRDNLLHYIASAMQHEYEQRSAEVARQLINPNVPITWPTILLRKTIAVIAFMPYTSESQPAWGDALTMVNLAATMASLVRHGCGRIIVVTDENEVVTNADNTVVVRNANGDYYNNGRDAPSKSFYLIHGAFQLLQEASRLAETTTNSKSSNTTNAEWFKAAQDIMERVSSVHQQEPGVVVDDLPPIVLKVAGTEVAFVAVDPNYDYYNDVTNTTETHYLVPKAALEGLKQAMLGQSDNPTRWLGDHAAHETKRRLSYWRYVYLTEPDSILQTRPSALAQFAQRAISRRDAILIPHRLQPIPHESDVRGYKDNRYWVPEMNQMQHVTLLDANAVVAVSTTTTREDKEHHGEGDGDDDGEYEEDDACCDGGIHRPKDDYDKCGNFWYVCGFQDEDVNDENYHKTNLERLPVYKRLFPYPLIRLQHGTGIVSLAATPHGRQCIPTKLKKNQKCPIPMTISSSSSSSSSSTTKSSETSDKSNGGDDGRRRQGGKNSQQGNHQQNDDDDDETNSQESRAAARASLQEKVAAAVAAQ